MEKYMAIVLGVFFFCIFGGQALEVYINSQCRVEAIKVNKSAEDIAKICK